MRKQDNWYFDLVETWMNGNISDYRREIKDLEYDETKDLLLAIDTMYLNPDVRLDILRSTILACKV